jgi:DICT domain-containing protein
MEIELDERIAACRVVVDGFAAGAADEAAVCRETQSLYLAAVTANRAYDGIWTRERSKTVEELLKKALEVHELLEQQSGTRSRFHVRLVERYDSLKDHFIHGEQAVSAAAQLPQTQPT